MAENKTKQTSVAVDEFLASVSVARQAEAKLLIKLMQHISGMPPVMWGPSIIGFGSQHYKYDSGREGDMPLLGFSPRKAAITVYFSEGFSHYSSELAKLGKYKSSVSCLYINKLEDIDMEVLQQMIEKSHKHSTNSPAAEMSVEAYVTNVPAVARPKFDELRTIVRSVLPKEARELVNYGIIGYKIDDKRARVFVSGWKDHLAVYPVPKTEALQADLKPFIKGKGTLWFPLDKPLPKALIKKVVKALVV